MKRFATLMVLFALVPSLLTAGPINKTIGTKTTTSIVGGRVLQKMETIAEPNPLPPAQNLLEREKSKPIPNTQRILSLVRWQSTDGAAIANNVATNAIGTNAFIGWYLNNERASFHDNNSATPIWEFPTDNTPTYYNVVALSADANIVALGSNHNLYLFDKTSGTITFNFPIPDSRIASQVAVSRDGQLLVCAAQSPLAGGIHRVYAFIPPSTTPIWTFDFSDGQSTGIYGINISIDKSIVAVNGKFYGYILNASNGTERTELPISNTESRLALSADGSVMGISELSGFIKAFVYNSGQSRYDLLWQYRIPPGVTTNWASAVAVSADGLTLMAGSLVFVDLTNGIYDGSVYLFDTFGEGTPNWIKTGLGDEVTGVALSDDGSLGAATTWGDFYNPSKPTTFVFERGSNQEVFSVSSPGSMFALAMSADGKTVVAGGKHTHARQFGSGGDVFDIAVDLGGGAISGTVLLGGVPPNQSGTLVQVLGTRRTGTTLPSGQYVVPNVPPGTYSVRISHLGYVGTTLTNITVTGTDTTRNVNATLPQAGAAPTNLVASGGLNSRIVLNWTNPTFDNNRGIDKETPPSVEARPFQTTVSARHPNQSNAPRFSWTNDVVPPDSVKIYRAIRTGGPYYLKRVLVGAVSTYTDSAVFPLKDYYYRVTAVNGQGESAYSNEAHGTVDSSFLQFSFTVPQQTGTTPTIDGTINPAEWIDAIKVDVSDVFGNGGGVPLPRGSAFMWFKFDSVAGKLYVAGEDFLNSDGLAANEGFGIYVDDNHNGQFEPIGTDPLLREGNYWGLYGSPFRFREIFTGGGVGVVDTVAGGQLGISNSTGHFTGELSIPISLFNETHLRVFGTDKTIGTAIYLRGISGTGASLYHGWWPQTNTDLFNPLGFGGIHIPIRLLAPPRPPSNLQVNRQGSQMRVTWTDPTQGINGDPLTVPATLELWRNGSAWRTFPTGVQSWTDSNTVAQGWYEYKMRGSITIASPSAGTYFGPFSPTVGGFAVSDPQLTEMLYDDGIPDAFYVVDFTYNGNLFGIRFTPQQYPARVYQVEAFTNNGNAPIQVYIYSDSSGVPGHPLAGPYTGTTFQTAGIDSFLVTLPANDPPTITSGDFQVVLAYLPTSPGAPGIGADVTPPVIGRSMYFTNSAGWTAIQGVDLMVRAFITGQTQGVAEGKDLPKVFALEQNYPNPFNPSTQISYQLPSQSFVSLKIFDILGREVATLVNEEKEPGTYSAVWNAKDAASGMYFYRLTAGAFTDVKKLMVLK